jgi:hypothetical protein
MLPVFNLSKTADVMSFEYLSGLRMCTKEAIQQAGVLEENVPWESCGLCCAEFVGTQFHLIQDCDCG